MRKGCAEKKTLLRNSFKPGAGWSCVRRMSEWSSLSGSSASPASPSLTGLSPFSRACRTTISASRPCKAASSLPRPRTSANDGSTLSYDTSAVANALIKRASNSQSAPLSNNPSPPSLQRSPPCICPHHPPRSSQATYTLCNASHMCARPSVPCRNPSV